MTAEEFASRWPEPMFGWGFGLGTMGWGEPVGAASWEGGAPEMPDHVIIGDDGNGQPIALAPDGSVLLLDHDEDFPRLVASSLDALDALFTAYTATTTEVGMERWLDGGVDEEVIDALGDELERIDPEAWATFWAFEIGYADQDRVDRLAKAEGRPAPVAPRLERAEALERAAGVPPVLPRPLPSLEQLFEAELEAARNLFAHGCYEQAIMGYDMAHRLDATHLEALLGCARCDAHLDPELAPRTYAKAIELARQQGVDPAAIERELEAFLNGDPFRMTE